MACKIEVTFQDLTTPISFHFSAFPFVTIRKLKQIVAETHKIPLDAPLRIFRVVSCNDEPQLFEELANNGSFDDYNVTPGTRLVASVKVLTTPQKNIKENEMVRSIQVCGWVPPPTTPLVKMQKDIVEVFSSFGPIFRVILSSVTPLQDDFTAFITFETREAARDAAKAMQSQQIAKALQEVTVLNKDIGVFLAVRDKRAYEPMNDNSLNHDATLHDDAVSQSSDPNELSRDSEIKGASNETHIEEESTVIDELVPKVPKATEQNKGDNNLESTHMEDIIKDSSSTTSLNRKTIIDVALSTHENYAHALAMAKDQLVQGYLDGKQGVALIRWMSETIPLRAKMGKPKTIPVQKRMQQFVSGKAKVVGTRVQGAARGFSKWFKRTTRKENIDAVKARVAKTARVASGNIKNAAKKVAKTAVWTTDTVKSRFVANSLEDNAEKQLRDANYYPNISVERAHDEQNISSHLSPQQEYFLKQAAQEAAAAATLNEAEVNVKDAVASSEENTISNKVTSSPISTSAPPTHLTFDDI